MTAQHTPGPWQVDAKSYPGGNPPATAYTVYELRSAPTIHAGQSREVEANARLIAAAPALLEALRAVVGFVTDDSACIDCGYEDYDEDGRLVSLPRDTHAATCSVPAALAAIRAATGEDA